MEIRFELPDGSAREVEVEDAVSVMQAAVRNGVPGIIGECGGEISCATCHVWVPEEWRARLRAPSTDEEELLEFAEHVTEDSRLGCQIKLTAELNGICVRVP